MSFQSHRENTMSSLKYLNLTLKHLGRISGEYGANMWLQKKKSKNAHCDAMFVVCYRWICIEISLICMEIQQAICGYGAVVDTQRIYICIFIYICVAICGYGAVLDTQRNTHAYAHARTHTHKQAHAHENARVHARTHARTHTHTYTHVHTHKLKHDPFNKTEQAHCGYRLYIDTQTHTLTRMRAHTHAHMHTQMNTHARSHTRQHTHRDAMCLFEYSRPRVAID